MDIYYVDGTFVAADEAVVPVNDLALLRGYGVFDLIRTYNGKPFFLQAHIDRLIHSAGEIGLRLPWSADELTAIVLETLRRNAHPEANLRVVVTGGPSPDFMTPQGKPRLLVLVTPIPKLPAQWYSEGVPIVTVVVERYKPGAKSINYIPATIALKTAREKGAIEALYIDREGFVLEGTTSNIFAFFGDRLITPGRGILSGITRQVVLDIAGRHYAIDIRDLSLEEMLAADEIFITGTNKGLVPVVQVDDRAIGDGRPGNRTRTIMAEMEKYTAGYTEAG
ncbi:MAG: aminotransferase class IV [Desulfobacterales bacterium]|nr:aminotransferase class IV [Desulfobacterales bacterium]